MSSEQQNQHSIEDLHNAMLQHDARQQRKAEWEERIAEIGYEYTQTYYEPMREQWQRLGKFVLSLGAMLERPHPGSLVRDNLLINQYYLTADENGSPLLRNVRMEGSLNNRQEAYGAKGIEIIHGAVNKRQWSLRHKARQAKALHVITSGSHTGSFIDFDVMPASTGLEEEFVFDGPGNEVIYAVPRTEIRRVGKAISWDKYFPDMKLMTSYHEAEETDDVRQSELEAKLIEDLTVKRSELACLSSLVDEAAASEPLKLSLRSRDMKVRKQQQSAQEELNYLLEQAAELPD